MNLNLAELLQRFFKLKGNFLNNLSPIYSGQSWTPAYGLFLFTIKYKNKDWRINLWRAEMM
jgi:hypothetical protein